MHTSRSLLSLAAVVALAGCGGQKVDLGGTDGGGGDSSGGVQGGAAPTVIASEIQLPPIVLLSDGTSLFWTGGGPGVSSMPVGGGAITTLVPGSVGLLWVDDVNVYYSDGPQGGFYRAPKGGGGTPTLITEAGVIVGAATVFGSALYWTEQPAGSTPLESTMTLESTPLQGGAITKIADFTGDAPGAQGALGITSDTAFFSGIVGGVEFFPLASGVADGGAPPTVPGIPEGCEELASDTDAVYCVTIGSMIRIASDGTTTTLGTVIIQGQQGYGIALDDTYVYWTDSTTVGTIMQVPKTGGTATVIARDTQPLALAVDANAVYWSDSGGSIMRLAK